MSSRLFLELRENRGLAYDVHSFTVSRADSGALAIYLGCEPGAPAPPCARRSPSSAASPGSR